MSPQRDDHPIDVSRTAPGSSTLAFFHPALHLLAVGLCAVVFLTSHAWTSDDKETGAAETAKEEELSWTPVFKGVAYAKLDTRSPRPLKIHAVRIDLRDPDIEFFVTPSNGDRPQETDGLKTSSFLKKYRCQLAINASPFRPVSLREGDPRDILGLSISRGEVYSAEQRGYGALLISKKNKAWIATPPADLSKAYNAVGGFRLLVKDGKNVGKAGPLHPRTAVGITKDGHRLLLLVIDGRQPGYSEGVTTQETAAWLLRLGAHSGLNLDGGGSTALVITDGRGGAKVLNRPIHGLPGWERVNGNHLGLFAKALEK